MLRIQRSSNSRDVFTLSGEIDEEQIEELKALIRSGGQGRPIVLDLKSVTLVDRESISFLQHCEADGATLENCPAYVREWITRNRHGS